MNRISGNDYCMVADGVKSTFPVAPTGLGGSYSAYKQTLAENADTEKKGYCGECMFPARLDHSHPLNVHTTGESGLTGDLNKVIQPIGPTGKLGSSRYYAREDHVHAFVSNGNANSQLPFTSPYARAQGSGIWTMSSSQTSTASGTNGTNADWAKWTRGITGNSSSGLLCGVSFFVVTGIRKYEKKACLYMRMCAFDENGCLKSLGLETGPIEVNTVVT